MTPIPVRFPPAMLDAINAIRAERMDAPDKGQVIRELVAEALAARQKKGRSSGASSASKQRGGGSGEE
jgi:hypothetical protein